MIVYARNKKRAVSWRTPAARKNFLAKQTCLRMNEEIRSITSKEKTSKNEWGSDDSDFLQALCNVYKKISTILFPYLVVNLFKQRYISSINKLSIKTIMVLFKKKMLCICAQSL